MVQMENSFMTIRRILALSFVLFVAAPLSAAQSEPVDLTGTWTGTLTRSTGEGGPAHIELKQKGAELTGTAGPGPDRQEPIRNAKVTTVKGVTSVTFETGSGAVMKFDLKVVEGRLKGNVSIERDGQKREAVLDVGRGK